LSVDDDFDASDVAAFDSALARRDAGDFLGAIGILEELTAKRPKSASTAGILAGLLNDVGDLERAALHARRAVNIAPRSDLASRMLLHILIDQRDLDAAFREAARFRTLKGSVEYDRLLGEWENDTLRALEDAPLDPFLKRLLDAVREEVRLRPIRQ
jgi:predicted Zn-dependent protease